MRMSKELGVDTSTIQTYGVVPQCFHHSLNHFRERVRWVTAIRYLGMSTTERKWRVGVGMIFPPLYIYNIAFRTGNNGPQRGWLHR